MNSDSQQLKGVLVASGIFALIAIALLIYEVIVPNLNGSSRSTTGSANQPSLEARQKALDALGAQEMTTSTSTASQTAQSVKDAQLQKLTASSSSTHAQTQTQTQTPGPNMDAKMRALDQLNH